MCWGLLLLLGLLPGLIANPLKDPRICGRPTCPDGGKFKYLSNVKYEYQYSVNVRTLFSGSSTNESTLHVDAKISMEFLSQCEGIFKVGSVALSEEINTENRRQKISEQSNQFSKAIAIHPVRFSFRDGSISEVCPHEDEPTWVLNFKKGILSMFQNSMKRFDVDHEIYETDINGNCLTHYSLNGADGTSLIIKRVKDIASCSNRYQHQSVIQSTPYSFRSDFQPIPIMKSNNTCNLHVDHSIYSKIECEEIHLFQPFSHKGAGANTITHQVLTLTAEVNTTTDEKDIISQRTSLSFDHIQTPKPTSGEQKASRDLVKLMCHFNGDDVEPEFPAAFSNFIYTARLLSYPALQGLYEEASEICQTGRKHVTDALPLLGSNAAVQVMIDAIKRSEVSESIANEWLFAMAFIPRPNLKTISIMTSLLSAENPSPEALFSLSSVTHTYCKWNTDCQVENEIQQILYYIQHKLSGGCLHTEKNKVPLLQILTVLKMLGNIGETNENLNSILHKCIENEGLPMELRLAAIDSYRRLPCEPDREFFIEKYRSKTEDTEIRIAAYLQVMKCPNYIVVKTIKHALLEEEVNQVGSFVWSHLHNLLQSSNPNRLEIQGLLQNNDLEKKFSSDIRKFSRNYEGSIFLDEYNAGGNYEGNLIFSPKSYIPRSGMLNLTVDLFGQSVNVFELSGRVEGFEQYLETLFGPKGPYNEQKIKELIPKRFLRSVPNNLHHSVNQLPNVIDNNFNDPKAFIGFKIFGNELKYGSFSGQREITDLLNKLNPFTKLQQLLSGKEMYFKKSAMFLDTNYVVPTGTGFPINLNAVGTAAIHLKMSGLLNIANFTSARELDVKAEIRPSVAVDIVGTMGVDAYYKKTGIKLKTNLYSSSAVEGQLTVRGAQLVRLSFNLPKEKSEIINSESELLVMRNGIEEEQAGIEEGKIQDKACSWPSIDETLGLMVCAHYHFPNTSHREDTASFILNGPSKFRIFLKKADPTAKLYLLEYKWHTKENASYVSFIFDTPGSKLKRELSFRINLDRNSQNVTLLIQSANNKYEALGTYKNTENEKYLHFGVDVNGKKNFDAEISLKTREGKYGNTYEPRFFLEINNTRIVELSGRLRWVDKKNVSQCDINLEFSTRKFFTKIFGYVKKTDTVFATSLKLDYRFATSKQEHIKLEAKFISKSLTRIQGSVELQSSAYPQFNFDSTVTYVKVNERVDFRMDLTVGPHLKDSNQKLVLTTMLSLLRTHESAKLNIFIHVTKPVSSIDLKLSISYHSTGPDYSTIILIRYAPGKEVLIQFSLKIPHTPLKYFEGKLNVTLPEFNPMVVEIKVHEKIPNEYDIDFAGEWFSGHSMTVKGLYQHKSTSNMLDHHLKLSVRSPSFSEVNISFKLIRDDTEFKINILGSYDNETYALLGKQVTPSPSEYEMYVEVRWKEKIYSVMATANLQDYKEISLDLHLDQYRNIHMLVRALNKPTTKEITTEIEWDANRDPLKKIVVYMHYDSPAFLNYSANAKISYPGRTLNAGLHFALNDPVLNSLAFFEWSPIEEINFSIAASYRYDTVAMISLQSQLFTPFDNWKRTSAAAQVHLEGNMFLANGSIYWKDNQNIEMILFGDYTLSDEIFVCEFNSSVLSTVEQVPSMSGSFYHKHGNNKYDTKLYLKYMPEQIISLKSFWELEQSFSSKNLTGTISLISPFSSYHKGVLITRTHKNSKGDITGVAELNIDRRKYAIRLKGHIDKLSNSNLSFNISTPLPNYHTITGRFGYSEANRHLVALIKGPRNGLGIEVLFNYINYNNFDIGFEIATPLEILREALFVARLKSNLADFEVSWNKMTLGFAGIWNYKSITNFEYTCRVYTPVEKLEVTGLTAKIMYGDGLDFDMHLLFATNKLGLKVKGNHKPQPPIDLQIANKKLSKLESDSHDYDDEDSDYEDALSWEGLIEIDTVIYPTIKGFFEIDEKDTVYYTHGLLTLPNGTIEFYDDFNFEDYFTVTNKLAATTSFETCRELESNLNYRVDFGAVYEVILDLKYGGVQNQWMKAGLLLNYSSQLNNPDILEIRDVHMNVYTPFESFKNFDMRAKLGREDGMYHTTLNLSADNSVVAITGTLDIEEDFTELSVGISMNSPQFKVPMTTFTAKKDFTTAEKKVELTFQQAQMDTQLYKLEASFLNPNKSLFKATIKMISPFDKLRHLEANGRYESHANEMFESLDFEVRHNNLAKFRFTGSVRRNELSLEVHSPLENFRHLTLKGTISENGKGSKLIDGDLRTGSRIYTLSGTLKKDSNFPVMVESRLVSKGTDTLTFTIEVAKKKNGYELTSAMRKSGEKLEFHGELTYIPGLEYHIILKGDSTHKHYKTALMKLIMVKNEIGNITVEMTVETPFRGFEKLSFLSYHYFQNGYGYSKVAFNIPQAKGSLDGRWVWIYMEDMNFKVNGFLETADFSKHTTVEFFYQNPKKKLSFITLGMDVNLDKGAWQCGANATMTANSLEDIEMKWNLKLPPPHFEIYSVYSKLKYFENYSYVNAVGRFSTHKSRHLYGYSLLANIQDETTDGHLELLWGSREISKIASSLKLIYKSDLVDMNYSLTTPYYNEKTLVATALFIPFTKHKNMKADIFWPENNKVAEANIDYRSITDMNGTVNSTTPFNSLPYAGLNFQIITKNVDYTRYFVLFWPNNTALLNSVYKYEFKNLHTYLNGSIDVEIPLSTRHIGKVEYIYQGNPQHKSGIANVFYNEDKVIDAKYNCDSASSAGHDEDIIDIELKNTYAPIGMHYVHNFDYSAGNDGTNLPTTDLKEVDLFRLDNRSAFSLSGGIKVHNTKLGQEVTITAIHANRTAKLVTDYSLLDNQLWQKSTLFMEPDAWISYDITLTNKTTEQKEEQHVVFNFGYPRRNYTAVAYYHSDDNSLASEITFEWDKQALVKTISGLVEWKLVSKTPASHHLLCIIKHPSFEKDVTLNGHYYSDDIDIINVNMDLEYSTFTDKRLSVSGKLMNNSDRKWKDYGFELMSNHPDTSLDLKVNGGIKIGDSLYQGNNIASYRRSYLPLQTGELKAMYDSAKKEIDLEKSSLEDASYLRGKYFGKYPEYRINGSVSTTNDQMANGNFYINFAEKYITVTYFNRTPDILQSLHVDGKIPDSRNAILNAWRNYDDVRVSDISFYLRLNHSRLITSKLLWRPELRRDIQKAVEYFLQTLYNDINDSMDYWKKYVKSETYEAIKGVWDNAEPNLEQFLTDLRSLDVIKEDFEEFKIFLNNSYNANEFYIRDIVGVLLYVIDELAIRGHFESLPKIFNEVWEVMGESGDTVRKSILWIVETVKNAYSKLMEFVNGLLKGESTSQISEMMEKLAEKYDKFMKDLHVVFKKQCEDLINKISAYLSDCWSKLLRKFEPSFVTFAHYVETVALEVSNEVLDFIYQRRNEIVESPFFSKVANFTQDIDKIYKDMLKNDAITNIKKYSHLLYKFLEEKYFALVPFGKELQQVAIEIITEFKELKKLHSIHFIIEKTSEVYNKIVWWYNYLDLGTKLQKVVLIIHSKLTDITQTALEAENRYREAKTKFIFDPENGYIDLEQKLPMSWHAFNETPKFEEIPEYKRISDMQKYFQASNTTFWTLYYEYKSCIDPSNWLPPFKGHALIAGPQHFMTFDQKFFEFRGSCSYLLTTDFSDRNFSLIIAYDSQSRDHLYDIILFTDEHVLSVDLFRDVVKLEHGAIRSLPMEIGDMFIYQEAAVVTIESGRGFTIMCNFKFDLCSITLSGWHYGKTFGLLGTMDNEPSNDFLSSYRVIETSVEKFAQSWVVQPNCVSEKNYAVLVSRPKENVRNLCEIFFKSKASQFSTCFSVVDPTPFMKMCLNSDSSDEKEACTTAIAYMQACHLEHTPLRIPDVCVKCQLLDGSQLAEGDFIQLKEDSVSYSTDIVFIVEASDCNQNLREKRNIDLVISLLAKELDSEGFSSNRFAVVTFGGNGVYSQPRSIVVDNAVFSTSEVITEYFNNIHTGTGNTDIFGAINYATKLVFRPGVSKTFILLPCSNCDSRNMTLDYSALHQGLLDHGITLHILMNDEFRLEKPRLNKMLYGIDGRTAYSKNDFKQLKGDKGLRRQVKLPKSLLGVCTALSLETNGSVFMAKRLESEKKNFVKKYLTVFSKRVVNSAKPFKCQTCECTAHNNGVSYMECFPCEYPVPEHIDYEFTRDMDIPIEHQSSVDYTDEDYD